MINISPMWDKVVNILSSARFWIIVLTAIVAILNGQPVLETVQMALSAIVALGTLDAVAVRLAGTKE